MTIKLYRYNKSKYVCSTHLVLVCSIVFFVILLPTGTKAQKTEFQISQGHDNLVNSAIFNSTGEYVLTSSEDNTARIWETSSGRLIRKFAGHTNLVRDAIFSPNEKQILTVSRDNTIKIWEVSTGKILHTYPNSVGDFSTAKFYEEGKKLAYITRRFDSKSKISNQALVIVNTTKGKQIKKIEISSAKIEKIDFTSDERYLYIQDEEGKVLLFDTSSWKHSYTLKNGSESNPRPASAPRIRSTDGKIAAVTSSRDAKYLITGLKTGITHLWDLNSMKITKSLYHEGLGAIHNVEISTNSKYVAVNSKNGIWVWDLESDNLTFRRSSPYLSKFSPDEKFIFCAYEKGSVTMSEIESGRLLSRIPGKYELTMPFAFSPDGKYASIVSGNYFLDFSSTGDSRSEVNIWDLTTRASQSILGKNPTDILDVVFSPDAKSFLTVAEDYEAKLWEMSSGKMIAKLLGHQNDLTAFFSPDGKRILTASHDYVFKVWDNRGILQYSINDKSTYFRAAAFNHDGTLFATAGDDGIIKIWETFTGTLKVSIEAHRQNANNPNIINITTLKFSIDGKLLASASTDKTIEVWNISKGQIVHTLKGHTGTIWHLQFTHDNQRVVSASADKLIKVWDLNTGRILQTIAEKEEMWSPGLALSPDDKNILSSSKDGLVHLYDLSSGQLVHVFEHPTDFFIKTTSARFSPDGKFVLTSGRDGFTKVWNTHSGKLVHRLQVNSDSKITSKFSPDSKYIVSTSEKEEVIFWDASTGKKLITMYPDENGSTWVHPKGFFDGSDDPLENENIYFVRGMELFGFSQLKDNYWFPGLWMAVFSKQRLPKTRGLDKIELAPTVSIGLVKERSLRIDLKRRDGGYGKVTISLNGKEVINDARGPKFDNSKSQQTIYYNLNDHPYLLKGKNSVKVKASSKSGSVEGRESTITFNNNKPTETIDFFALAIGVGDYRSDQIDLKYPEKDVSAISKSLELGAKNLFGEEHTHIYTLKTNTDSLPSKENIVQMLDHISKKAGSEDIIVIYLSGHGITLNKEFYFLTSDARSNDAEVYKDPYTLSKYAIGTQEWIEFLKTISALKQLMIIDACSSGRVIDNLLTPRNVNPSQIKAIERMKERVGMFIISGCAADAESYEASRYGQGLLTYSILEGMRGAAIVEDKFVDVNSILNYARENVPKIAGDLGGVQEPQMLIPKGGSFDIGILPLKDRSTIPLAAPKHIFVSSNLVDAHEYADLLNLSEQIDLKLSSPSNPTIKSEIVFFDARNYPNSCKITGGYTTSDQRIELKMKLRCGDTVSDKLIQAKSKEELITQIVSEVLQHVQKNQ